MILSSLVLIVLLVMVTLPIGAGVLALQLCRPAWGSLSPER